MSIGFNCVCTLSKNESDTAFFERGGFYALDHLLIPAVVVDSNLRLIRVNRPFLDFFSVDVEPVKLSFCAAIGCKNYCTCDCMNGFKEILNVFGSFPDRSNWINSSDGKEKIRFINRVSRFCDRDNLYAVVLDQDSSGSLFDRRRIRMMQLAYAGKMTAFFAHEINNPLQICYFSTDTLGRFMRKGEAKLEHVDRIVDGLGRISKIVRKMLAVNAGSDEQKRSIDISHVVMRVGQRLKDDFNQKGIELNFDFEKGMQAVEVCDTKVFGVLEYLLLNALAVSVNGQKVLVLTGSTQKNVFIEVRDKGEKLNDESLFDPERSLVKGTNYGLRLFAAEGLSDMSGAALERRTSDIGNVYRLVFNIMVRDEV